MKLRPVVVGTRYFDERPVTATDPCYNSDVWCAMHNIKVKPGNYECIAWKRREYYTLEGRRHSCSRVFACGIYLDNIVPYRHEMKEIGAIGVDAGLAGFFQDKPDYDDDEWGEFCDKIHGRDYIITEDGFCTSSGYGDGYYPVFASKDSTGEIVALEIRY